MTTDTLFRGDTAGDLTGPYISQFLWKDIPYGPSTIVQKYRSSVPGVDFLTTYSDCLAVQRGAATGPTPREATPRYIRNGRDLGEWVRMDFTYQAFLNAALVLLGTPGLSDDANSYVSSATQAGFITFGGPYALDLVARVANLALMAAWFQKWLLPRTLRPEAFGARIQNHLTGVATYPIHDDILTVSSAPGEVFSKYGNYLLPMAYSEGCPAHPSYPAGHAAIAGACTTVLKALFAESAVIPDPVEASADGLSLNPYLGVGLTVGGELNKLAANIAIGRDTAGVHYRSDGIQGLLLGEAVAIGVLTEMRLTYSEPFEGFSLTRFDGTTVVI